MVERISIPGCIGCGSLREYETCERCDYEALDLVAATEFDQLHAAQRADADMIDAMLSLIKALARPQANAPDYQLAQQVVATDARRVLRQAVPSPTASADPAVIAENATRVSVWRCRVCGGVDAPQECIGVCIWRRFEWVRAGDFEDVHTEATQWRALRLRCTALLRRVAFSKPREGMWERNLDAFSDEAGVLVTAFASLAEPPADRS
ncbi:MAG: hypothetical protein ACP5H2_09840 [Solirubrobacteraceae bacterium]